MPAGLNGDEGKGNNVLSGLDRGDDAVLENDAVGCEDRSSSLSQMSAQRSEASPATELPELEHASEVPIEVLSGLPKSVDLKHPKSADVKPLVV